MSPNTKTHSGHKPTRWDQHCLLVLQFPISLQSEVRLSARFAGVKLELLRNLAGSAPKRARNFFMHPSMFRFPFGFGPAGETVESQETPTRTHSMQAV